MAFRKEGAVESMGPSYHPHVFALHVHPAAKAWAPRPPQMEALRRLFGKTKADVHIYPRSMANQILGRHAAPYAFRGFTRGTDSYLFVDSTETPESIAWLMAHELCHRMVAETPTMKSAFTEAAPHDLDPAGDSFHDIDPEERFCDGIATNLLGYRQDREWWRKRTPGKAQQTTAYGGLTDLYGAADHVC